MASYQTSNQLPAWIPVFTLIGHGPESANLNELQTRIKSFFHAQASDDARLSLINEFDINYVFYGPEERELGSWDPSSLPDSKLMVSNDSYQIYQITK